MGGPALFSLLISSSFRKAPRKRWKALLMEKRSTAERNKNLSLIRQRRDVVGSKRPGFIKCFLFNASMDVIVEKNLYLTPLYVQIRKFFGVSGFQRAAS